MATVRAVGRGRSPSATLVEIATPAPLSDCASFAAATLAGSEAKPLALALLIAGVEGEPGEGADVGAGRVAGVGDPAQAVEDRVVGVEAAGHRVDARPRGSGLQRVEVGAEAAEEAVVEGRACRAPGRRRPAGRGCRAGRRGASTGPSRAPWSRSALRARSRARAVEVVNSFMFEASGRWRPRRPLRRRPARSRRRSRSRPLACAAAAAPGAHAAALHELPPPRPAAPRDHAIVASKEEPSHRSWNT